MTAMGATGGNNCILALSGGVGGAKLALGLSRAVPAHRLAVVCNTGDDFQHLGLTICPDLDTVTYTLAGRNNTHQGWGLADESWQVMAALKDLGGPDWFNLGDRDLATHLYRSELLSRGLPLSAVSAKLCAALGVAPRVLPMSDDRVSTRVLTDSGELSFQHYFVREQCRPRVLGFRFVGSDSARPHPDLVRLLTAPDLGAVVLCPSNPYVSIDPILSLPGVRALLRNCPAPVIAVSPIVGGRALKGPAAKMMGELGVDCSALAVAEYYRDIVDGFVLDTLDGEHVSAVADLGLVAVVANTVMVSLDDRLQLARAVLALAGQLAGGSTPCSL